jgi:hypothetical protein
LLNKPEIEKEMSQPTRSNLSTQPNLLDTEPRGKGDLQDLFNSHNANMFELNRKVQEAREKQAALEARLEMLTRSLPE